VEGDGLARALRQRFKKLGRFPAVPFSCVCSTEPPVKLMDSTEKGSLMTVTATFGMCLAAEAVKALT
jgi:tRNA A37 threonylcarbamoyladenosine dehydratase